MDSTDVVGDEAGTDEAGTIETGTDETGTDDAADGGGPGGPGCAGLLLLPLIGLGLLGWLLLGVLGHFGDQAATDTGGLGLYLDTAAAWALLAAGVGIRQAYAPGQAADQAVNWLALAFAGVLLAIAWPVQAGIVAVTLGVGARSRARWPRWAVALAGIPILVGGAAWGVGGYQAEQPWQSGGHADSAFLGSWTGAAAGRLELDADGRFTADGFAENGYWPPLLAQANGVWQLVDGPGGAAYLVLVPPGGSADGTVRLSDGTGDDSAVLGLYGHGSPSSLCLTVGLDQPCALALHRG